MLTQWLGRNSFDGNGGGWPVRVGLNDQNAYYDGSQVQIGKKHQRPVDQLASTSLGARARPRHRRPHPGRHLRPRHPGVRRATSSARSPRWFANEPSRGDPPDFLVGETVNLVGSGPIRNMYNPSALGDQNCYASSVPNGRGARGRRPRQPLVLPAAPRAPTRPTASRPAPTCNSSTVTGLGVQNAIKIFYNAMLLKTSSSVVPEVPHLDADRGQEPVPGQLRRVQHGQGGVGRDAACRPQSADPTCSATGTRHGHQPGQPDSPWTGDRGELRR